MTNRVRAIEDCLRPHYGKGWCLRHYTAWRRHGDPLASARPVRGICSKDGCQNVVHARGFCSNHYNYARRRPPCSIEGCDRPAWANGWCSAHLTAWQRTGSPVGSRRPPLAARFWTLVDLDGPIPAYAPDLGACWLWTGALSDRGYGAFRIGGRSGKTVRAHRWAFEDANGPIPEGLEPDHLCRVRACVRPDHQEAVTHRENLRRGAEARRTA